MTYTIKELERLSGVKAHTIRIWEKRYELFQPERNAANIRLYSDEELIRLLNVATLQESKWKISKISQLSDEELNKEVRKVVLSQPGNANIQINDLLGWAMAYDEVGFNKALSYNFQRLGVRETIVNIVYPFLFKVGILWQVSDLNPAQEHFASNIIRRKLLAVIDNLPIYSDQQIDFLLFLPEGEYHEISLLVADYLIRSAGYRTCYLGANVPLDSTIHAMQQLQPSYLLTFFIAQSATVMEAGHALELLEAKFEGKSILVSGQEGILPSKETLSDRVQILSSISELQSLLDNKEAGRAGSRSD